MNKLLGNLKEGLLFVISAPAGAGKNTLVNLLEKEFSCVKETVSCTTRPKRTNETDGREYFFLSQEAFQKKIQEDAFIEHKQVLQEHYGTLKSEVKKIQSQGKHVICVIDVQGGLQIKKQMEAVLIFIQPPSLAVAKQRLEKRNTESSEIIAGRLKLAEEELKKAPAYDYQLVNDDLDQAYQVLRSIFIAEEHRTRS